VLDGIHLHFFLSCLAAGHGGMLGVAARGFDEFGVSSGDFRKDIVAP
jgi:hypothetical protein